MEQETTIYVTNLGIAAILACLLTQHWRQGRTEVLRWWMLAAWIMFVADVFFAARPELPYWVGRLVPTLLVTVGHAALFVGARLTARRAVPWGVVGGVVGAHALLLGYFLTLEQATHWRMVSNGAVWAGFSVASMVALRAAAGFYWQPILSPANAFLGHSLFLLARSGTAIFAAQQSWPAVHGALQTVGDLEVSFFMVALFVAVLIATLQQRHEELMGVRAEVEALTGLLPICAWCKKVRDDSGYWQQVEHYFEKRDHIRFTHGICVECVEKQAKEFERPPRK